MTERDRLIRAVLARATAAGRRVYGFSSEYASCAEARAAKRKKADKPGDGAEAPPGIVPNDWDRLCVEGDAIWTALPPAGVRPSGLRDAG